MDLVMNCLKTLTFGWLVTWQLVEQVVWREWKPSPLGGGHTVQKYSLWVGTVDVLAIGWDSVQRSRCPVFKLEEA